MRRTAMKKFPKVTYNWTQTWSKNDWGQHWTQSNSVDLLLTAYDLLENDVEASKNKQAIEMLEAVGIKCG